MTVFELIRSFGQIRVNGVRHFSRNTFNVPQGTERRICVPSYDSKATKEFIIYGTENGGVLIRTS